MPAVPEAFFLPSTRFTPAYLQLGLAELRRRAAEALDLLRSCVVCPRDCRVDRLADRWALCKTGRYAIVGSFFPHFGEEDCLRGWNGSGTIFFSMCNLRCVFCFRPGARVVTDRGMQRIEEIFEAAGDEVVVHGGRVRFPRGVRVVTATGRLATVTKAFRHPYEGTLVVIKPVGLPAIACTPNHELFVRLDGQPTMTRVRADELTTRHRLLVPLPAPGAPLAIDVQAVLRPFVGTYRRPARRRTPLHALPAEAALASAGLASPRKVADRLGYGPSPGRRPAPACVPIRSITRVPYAGPVYNLEVADESHSYLVNGVAVANCQNYDISQLGEGRVVTPQQLAAMMLHLQDQGCHNINFVTPEHVVPQILEALPLAVEHGLRLPIVYNTSSYDSMHSLRLLDGIVDIYMPDFKYWTPERARHYLKAPDYPEVARRVITEMHRQVGPLSLDEHGLAKRGLIVRHLVMPGALDDTRAILRWIATTLGPETYVNVMDQYYPAGQVGKNPKYEDINRRLLPAEFAEAVQAAREAGLVRLDVRIPRRPWVRWEPVPTAAAV